MDNDSSAFSEMMSKRSTRLMLNGKAVNELVVPEGVKKINDFAFMRYAGLSKAVLPDGLAEIGTYAFGHCINLEEITVPGSLKKIEYNAFHNTNIRRVRISDIGGWAETPVPCRDEKEIFLDGKPLTDIRIPGSVSKISAYSFSQCKTLTSVTIEEGVQEIDYSAFEDCENLTGVFLPASIRRIGPGAFLGCLKLEKIHLAEPDGLTKIKLEVGENWSGQERNPIPESASFYYQGENLSKSMQDTVIDKDGVVLAGHKEIITVMIRDGVTAIAPQAFENCSNLKNITIPDSVKRIGEKAFGGCEKLEEVHVSSLSSWLSVIFESPNTFAINPLSYGARLFVGGEPVEEVVIPENISVIGAQLRNYRHMKTLKIHNRVQNIQEQAFVGCTGLKRVELPDSLPTISRGLFSKCTNLSTVILPQHCDKIEKEAFHECSSLKSIALPSTLKAIGEDAFAYSGLTKIEIPASVSVVEHGAFAGCNKLSDVIIGGKDTDFVYSVFCFCTGLKNVRFPENVKTIGSNMFWDCELTTFCIPETIEKLGEGVFDGNCFKNLYIPDSVRIIDSKAVTYKDSGRYLAGIDDKVVSDISIPGSIDEMDNHAFGWSFLKGKWFINLTVRGHKVSPSLSKFLNANKERLKILFADALANEIPAQYRHAMTEYWAKKLLNHEEIDPAIYTSYLKYLKDHKKDWLDKPDFKNDEAIFRLMMKEQMIGATETETLIAKADKIPELSAALIDYQNRTFSLEDYDKETEKEFRKIQRDAEIRSDPTSQKYIDAMWTVGRKEPHVKSLKEVGKTVVFPTQVGKTAVTGISDKFEFKGGQNAKETVEEIIIPEGYTCIGEDAFSGCSNLSSITIPDSMAVIGKSAFRGCYSLKKVYVRSLQAWLNVQFGGWGSNPCTNGAELYIGGELATHITIPDGVKSVYNRAFQNCKSLTAITIPKSVTSIGECAFADCSGLASITIPKGVKRIEAETFSGCSLLTNITIPDSVTSINSRAFQNCKSLTGIMVPERVTVIGEYAFAGCSSLTGITLPKGVKRIETGTFSGCSILTNITIPDGVRLIGDNAFENCKKLKAVDLPEAVCAVGHHAFADSGIKTLVIRNKYLSLTDTACLHGCRNYTIYVPEGSAARKYIPERTQSLETLPGQNPIPVRKTAKVQTGTLKGLTFVVTGDLDTWPDRADLKDFIENAGGRLTGSVSGKTDYLIANDPESGTTKLAKARQLGVQIIDEQDFLKLAGKN